MAPEDSNPWAADARPWLRCIRPVCGYRWRQRFAAKPRQCPRCHNAHWERPPTAGVEKMRKSCADGKFKCLRCGGRWNPRVNWGPKQRPIRCQRCGCANWWRPPSGHPGYMKRWKARRKATRPT